MSENLQTWDAWHTKHQPFELGWWREHLDQLHDPTFKNKWAEIVEFIKPGRKIVDIGCGPRPPFRTHGQCAVIEPLARAYQELTPAEWWHDVWVYTQPAEERIIELAGTADTVVCWNALNHAIGWRQIIRNMLYYANDIDNNHARFAISTDFFEPFLGHPGFTRGEFMSEIERRFTIIEQREPFDRALALLLTNKAD